MTSGEHLSAEQLADRWGLSPRTLSNWRYKKPAKGPAFIKIGAKVLYPIDEVRKYEAQNLKNKDD